MKNNLSLWQFGGFALTSLGGTLLHFLYDWSGQAPVVGLFSAVNESIWEHMKLLFYPMLMVSVVEGRVWGNWCIKALGITVALLLVPVLYYTYTGALGVYADWFNITIFFLSSGAAFYLEYKLQKSGVACNAPTWLVFAWLGIWALCFTVFTFYPPNIPLFQSP